MISHEILYISILSPFIFVFILAHDAFSFFLDGFYFYLLVLYMVHLLFSCLTIFGVSSSLLHGSLSIMCLIYGHFYAKYSNTLISNSKMHLKLIKCNSIQLHNDDSRRFFPIWLEKHVSILQQSMRMSYALDPVY